MPDGPRIDDSETNKKEHGQARDYAGLRWKDQSECTFAPVWPQKLTRERQLALKHRLRSFETARFLKRRGH